MTLTPTQQEKITALKNAMDGYFVNESDIATSFSDNPSDAKVASEKLVKDSLDGKANSSHTHTKSQITDFPTIPSKTSQLTNDSGFLTSHQSLSNYYNKSETNNYDVDFILGTQTTSTSAWTGTTSVISSLRAGTTIFYKLPYASTSTSVTLNLTLKGGGTTGAKNVFYKNTTRVTTHFGVGQVVGLTYDGTAWYVISPSDNNSNNDNNYGGIQFKAGEALTTQTICCAKDNGQYYKVANGVVLDIRYPLIMTSSAVTSGTTTNAMYRTWYAVNIANTKSMTLTNGSQLFLEGTTYSDGKFTISSNVVTHTLTNGRYYINVGTALSTTQIRFISDMTVYYYNGTTLKPVIKKEQIVDFPTIPDVSGKEDKSNKVTSISSSSTDTQYPSAKLVYDTIDTKIDKLQKSVTTFNPIDYVVGENGAVWNNDNNIILPNNSSNITFNFTDMLNDTGDYFEWELRVLHDGDTYMWDETNKDEIWESSANPTIRIRITKNENSESYHITTTDLSNNTIIKDYDKNYQFNLTIRSMNGSTFYFSKKKWYHTVSFIDMIYPIGSIYMSVNSINPSLFIGGTWEQIKDRFLLGAGDTYSNGETGGEATHTLTTNEMPSHTHIQNSHNHTQNAHSHGTAYNNYAFVVSENTKGASNKRVTAVSSGSTYVPTDSSARFHHYMNTNSQTPTINSQTATNQSTGDGGSHNNMPPYLAVYIWKRIA